MSNPLNVEFSLQYGIYFYKWNLTFHSSNYCTVHTKNKILQKKKELSNMIVPKCVRITGVEPARDSPLEPKSSASANSAISANKCATGESNPRQLD